MSGMKWIKTDRFSKFHDGNIQFYFSVFKTLINDIFMI